MRRTTLGIPNGSDAISLPNGKGMHFRPLIIAFDAGADLRWRGKLLFTVLFDGEHYFVLRREGEHRIKLI